MTSWQSVVGLFVVMAVVMLGINGAVDKGYAAANPSLTEMILKEERTLLLDDRTSIQVPHLASFPSISPAVELIKEILEARERIIWDAMSNCKHKRAQEVDTILFRAHRRANSVISDKLYKAWQLSNDPEQAKGHHQHNPLATEQLNAALRNMAVKFLQRTDHYFVILVPGRSTRARVPLWQEGTRREWILFRWG